MMYSPAHYKEDRTDLILETVRRFSFATLISSSNEGPFISHLPLLLEESNDSLIGHCARANPQWRHFIEGQSITAIFNGPHAYISPAWYEPQPDNVPTWNYVAVHIRGKAQVIEQPHETYSILQKTVRHFESKYGTCWSLPIEPNEELGVLLKAIVAFRINIEDIQAKFKLSQKQGPTDRNTVVEQLSLVGGSEGLSVAEYMKLVMQQGLK